MFRANRLSEVQRFLGKVKKAPPNPSEMFRGSKHSFGLLKQAQLFIYFFFRMYPKNSNQRQYKQP